MDQLRETNEQIPPNFSDEEIEAQVSAILSEEPLHTLISNWKGCFYIGFRRSDV